MGIFGGGSNLPPGCRVSDIPGNSPEDGIMEAITDAFFDNKENQHKQKRFTPAEWKYLGSKHRSCHLEEIIYKAIEYGINVESARAYESEKETRCYDRMAVEEALDSATSPVEALEKVKRIFGIGERK